MTFIGRHLPELVPFMEDTYTPQAVNQARNAFKKKVRKSSATFFYGAMCGFFTTDELDDLLFEASEVARVLLEVEGTTLDIDEEIDIEDRITKVMRGVGEAAKTLLKNRGDERTVKDQQESTIPVIAGSEPEVPSQGYPDSPAAEGIPDNRILPDPSRPESFSPTTAGLSTEAEIPDRPPIPGEDQIFPETVEIPGNDDPASASGDNTHENARGKPGHSGKAVPEPEDP